MSPLIRRALAFFLPVAVLVTALCGLVYLEVQQDLRSGANDPQYQMATDAATRLDGGTAPSSVVDSTPGVDLATSLAPFVIVFDRNHSILATDATLDGGRPAPPDGVLDAAGPSDPNLVTWQPRTGVRIATVAVAWSGGTVVAGRSLRLVEDRETNAELIAGLAWIASLVALAAASLVAARLWPAPSPGEA
ncbi:MAG TPA: hypothetical protein VIK06_08700 [Candidatus Limnocylindrales bacterium]